MGSRYRHGADAERRVMVMHKRQGAIFSQRFAGSHGLWDGVSYFPDRGTVWWQVKYNCRPPAAELQAMVRFAEFCTDDCELILMRSRRPPVIERLVDRRR